MNWIFIKFGFLFLMFILLIEVVFFFYLYSGFVNIWILEELESLCLRGNSYWEVLEKYYDLVMFNYVVLMEFEVEIDVVIIDKIGKIISLFWFLI